MKEQSMQHKQDSKMTIEELNEINSGLSKLISKFGKYDQESLEVLNSIKELKSVGKRAAEIYYKVKEEDQK